MKPNKYNIKKASNKAKWRTIYLKPLKSIRYIINKMNWETWDAKQIYKQKPKINDIADQVN